MITKEDILEKLLNTCIGDKHRAILKLALRGLESEDLICGHRIVVNNLNHEIDGLNRSRNFWRKKYESLADELEDKIIAIEEMLKAKDADLSEASIIINDARTKHRVLEAQLIESMAGEHAIVDDANRSILQLRYESDAFQRCVGELQTEKSCLQADLENVCKEQEALKGKIDELEEELGSKDDDWRLSVSYYMNLAAVWEKRAEDLVRWKKEAMAELEGWDLVVEYLRKSPHLTIGDTYSEKCLEFLQERDALIRFRGLLKISVSK